MCKRRKTKRRMHLPHPLRAHLRPPKISEPIMPTRLIPCPCLSCLHPLYPSLALSLSLSLSLLPAFCLFSFPCSFILIPSICFQELTPVLPSAYSRIHALPLVNLSIRLLTFCTVNKHTLAHLFTFDTHESAYSLCMLKKGKLEGRT